MSVNPIQIRRVAEGWFGPARRGFRISLIPLIVGFTVAAPPGLAQDVFFDVTPLIGPPPPVTPVGPVPPTTVVVPPGTVVPYELGVFVQPTPGLPEVNGLASFDVNILTTLGVSQPPLTAFDPLILQTFTVFPSLGLPSNGSILNITAGQDLSGFANTGVGVGRRQRLATGQLNTPFVEGDFQVSLTGTAGLVVTGIVPGVRPAVVGPTTGFIIQTRLDAEIPDDDVPDIIDPDSPAANFGASLVSICFPGVMAVVPGCILGLIGLRRHFRR
jgi:hypothetical protein